MSQPSSSKPSSQPDVIQTQESTGDCVPLFMGTIRGLFNPMHDCKALVHEYYFILTWAVMPVTNGIRNAEKTKGEARPCRLGEGNDINIMTCMFVNFYCFT